MVGRQIKKLKKKTDKLDRDRQMNRQTGQNRLDKESETDGQRQIGQKQIDRQTDEQINKPTN